MSAWSPAAAAVLAFSAWRAFAGAPPVRPRPRLGLLVAPAAVAAYAASVLALMAGEDALALFGLMIGIESACLTAWLARSGGDADGDDDPDGGGGSDRDPERPEPPAPDDGLTLDWDRFDRARDGWEPRVEAS